MATGGTVRCLAHAAFATAAGDTCGEIWLLSTDPKLMECYGTDASLPNVLSAQSFRHPLGVVAAAKGFGDGLFVVDKGELQDHLIAIRNADVARLYSLDKEYVPFYCARCQVNYGRSEWSAAPVFDGDFFDYLEGTCPLGHRRMLQD